MMLTLPVLCVLLGLVSSVLSSVPTRAISLDIDGGPVGFQPAVKRVAQPVPGSVIARSSLTNAQRLARGLPPLPPSRRRSGQAAKARRSNSPPVSRSGIIAVSGPGVQGYLTQGQNQFQHFGVSSSKTNAFTVTINVDSSVLSASEMDIGVAVGTGFPLMGATFGVLSEGTANSLAVGSFNYAYIQSTSHTDPDSTPQYVGSSYPTSEPSESAIWTYNAVTNTLSPQWINPDGSQPATVLAYVGSSNAIIITGDYAAFSGSFATTSGPVTFTFQPSA
ncbi:unnamed protein product [Mycena citricolor]|uniref:Acid protease n=1 Tax=Mycena citricolor TaxID=2018698 RepID=A0AAD2HL20_9AGAR|nr:unnamed protein product [Mycena citricolor]